MAIVYGWCTWGHWGDLQIDSGREMYVPVEILRRRLLFRDIWYQYGPLTPYVQAWAVGLFGIKDGDDPGHLLGPTYIRDWPQF